MNIPETPTTVLEGQLFRNRMSSLGRNSLPSDESQPLPKPLVSADLHRPVVYFPPQADVESLKGSIHDTERRDDSIRKMDALGTVIQDYTARSVKELTVTKVY